MEQLIIKTDLGESKLLLGESIKNIGNYLPDTKVVVITDTNVRELYEDFFPEEVNVIEIGTGEENKTLETLSYIYEKLVEFEIDRSSFIVGIGGGIVCDITGFAASTFMRGIKFGFVSTTLLSQVDASIGGKNGVNFKGFKNMIGVFNQPEFVICDFTMLMTLPEDEYIAGYAEIIKHAIIKNYEMFCYLEKNVNEAMEQNLEVIHRVVYDSLVIKSEVVQKDEKETGLRRMLNFGHTIGHAIEKNTGLIHGKAVAMGMVLSAKLSEKRGYITKEDVKRITDLISAYKLPVDFPLDKKEIVEIMKKDKKREKQIINFVLISKIGEVKFEAIPVNELEDIINDLC